MTLQDLLRNSLSGLAMLASLYSCSPEPSCRGERIYKEGIGCVDKGVSDDAGGSDIPLRRNDVPSLDRVVDAVYNDPGVVLPDVQPSGDQNGYKDVVFSNEGDIAVNKDVTLDLYAETFPSDVPPKDVNVTSDSSNDNGKPDQADASTLVDILKLGDVNCDGKVDSSDGLKVQQYVNGKINVFTKADGSVCTTGLQAANVDCSVDASGKPTITQQDADLILKYAVGALSKFKECLLGGGCVDEELFYADNDQDGWGGSAQKLCYANTTYFLKKGGDCDDSNPAINPGAKELCNSLDLNCNGKAYEGCSIVTVCDSSTIKRALYVIHLDGSPVTKLVEGKDDDKFYYPRWSPDGKKVAVQRTYKKVGKMGYFEDLDQALKTFIPLKNVPPDCKDGISDGIDWSTKDVLAIACGQGVLYTINPDGTNLKKYFTDPKWGFNFDPSWTSDGQILYTMIDFSSDSGVYIFFPSLGGYDLIKNQPAYCSSSAANPLSDSFLMSCPYSTGSWESDLYTLEISGKNLKQVTGGVNVRDFYPSWSPDGKKFAFTRAGKNSSFIAITSLAQGSVVEKPNQPPNCVNADWKPQ